MDFVWVLLCIVLGYLVGSIPFALVIGKLFYHTDVREHGSGNLGGSNAGRVLGKGAGIAVIILDVLKVVLCIWIAAKVSDVCAAWTGFACCIGHCYPVFAHFKGGKAVSTVIGFLLGMSLFVLYDWWFFIAPVIMFFVMLYLFRWVGLASIAAVLCAALLFTAELAYGTAADWAIIAAGWGMAVLVIYRHWGNVKRIQQGEEPHITWMGKI